MEKVVGTRPIYGPEKPDGSKDLWGVDVIVEITDIADDATNRETFVGPSPFEFGSDTWKEFVADAIRRAPNQAFSSYCIARKM